MGTLLLIPGESLGHFRCLCVSQVLSGNGPGSRALLGIMTKPQRFVNWNAHLQRHLLQPINYLTAMNDRNCVSAPVFGG
jgi:hypothetical protein